jgi:hypothetical protein
VKPPSLQAMLGELGAVENVDYHVVRVSDDEMNVVSDTEVGKIAIATFTREMEAAAKREASGGHPDFRAFMAKHGERGKEYVQLRDGTVKLHVREVPKRLLREWEREWMRWWLASYGLAESEDYQFKSLSEMSAEVADRHREAGRDFGVQVEKHAVDVFTQAFKSWNAHVMEDVREGWPKA